MKRHAALFLVVGLSLSAGELPTYPCYWTAIAPVIDGNVSDDPAWKTVPGVTGFRKLGADYTMDKQSTAMAAWDQEALTIAMVCEEPDAAKLSPRAGDGGQTWTEDSVEIFVLPDAKGSAYQIGVTCAGAKGAGAGSPDISLCQAAAHIGSDTYELELRIPYKAIGAQTPPDAACWGISFCRNIWTTDSGGDKYTCWAPLQARFLEPGNFARLIFHAATLSAGEAGRMTLELNTDYRHILAERVRAAAARSNEYLTDLAAAAGDRRFAEEAKSLMGQWSTIREVAGHAESAEPGALRTSVSRLDILVEASYTLKYRYLMEKLFDNP